VDTDAPTGYDDYGSMSMSMSMHMDMYSSKDTVSGWHPGSGHPHDYIYIVPCFDDIGSGKSGKGGKGRRHGCGGRHGKSGKRGDKSGKGSKSSDKSGKSGKSSSIVPPPLGMGGWHAGFPPPKPYPPHAQPPKHPSYDEETASRDDHWYGGEGTNAWWSGGYSDDARRERLRLRL